MIVLQKSALLKVGSVSFEASNSPKVATQTKSDNHFTWQRVPFFQLFLPEINGSVNEKWGTICIEKGHDLWVGASGTAKLQFFCKRVIFINCDFTLFIKLLIFVNWCLPAIKVCLKKQLLVVNTNFVALGNLRNLRKLVVYENWSF